jgi:HD-like signal output (HDOD) protein
VKDFPAMNVVQRLYEITELPALPEILVRVQRLVNSEEGNATILAKIIQQDPSLAVKVLKVANSAFFCPANQRISSLQLAIARIGFNEIRSIIMAITLIKQFSKKSNVLDYKQFWRHSLASAYFSQTIINALPAKYSSEERQICFLSSLLHDIGILVYDQFFHKEFEQIMNSALSQEKPFLFAEQMVAGKESHPMVGSALLELWKIESPVISGVRFHHVFDKAPDNHARFWAVTYLAEYVLCNLALGSFEGTIQEVKKSIWDILGLSPDSLGALFTKAEIDVEKAGVVLEMETGGPNTQLRMV